MNRIHTYMGNYTVLTQLIYGPKMYLDSRELSMTGHLIIEGYWEKWVTDVFRNTIGPGMTVCDFGANCGYYSMIAAQLVGSEGKVHAFEPNPFHHENFTKSKLINGFYHVQLHPVALSDRKGEIVLHSPVRLTASASAVEDLARQVAAEDKIQKIFVPSVRLQDYLPNLQADVIKLDIEGLEPIVLPDILNVMERSKDSKLFLEYNQHSWEIQGYDCLEILSKIMDKGYSINVIRHDSSLQNVTPKELVNMTINATHFDLLIARSS